MVRQVQRVSQQGLASETAEHLAFAGWLQDPGIDRVSTLLRFKTFAAPTPYRGTGQDSQGFPYREREYN